MGGLGGAICPILLTSGIALLGLMDFDRVETSNLHRQTLFTPNDVGRSKVECARTFLSQYLVHPDEETSSKKKIVSYEMRVSRTRWDELLPIFASFDVVVDATDDVDARYVINDLCIATRKPLVSGCALGFSGQVSVFHTSARPELGCYRCAHPEPIPLVHRSSCGSDGVLGPLPHVIGSFQALEVLKLLLDDGSASVGTLFALELRASLRDDPRTSLAVMKLRRREGCESCCCGARRVAPVPVVDRVAHSDPAPRDDDVLCDREVRIDCRPMGDRDLAIPFRFVSDLSIPLERIREDPAAVWEAIVEWCDFPQDAAADTLVRARVSFACRRGVSSRLAAEIMTRYSRTDEAKMRRGQMEFVCVDVRM